MTSVDGSEILHQLICSFSHYLEEFIHPRWFSTPDFERKHQQYLKIFLGIFPSKSLGFPPQGSLRVSHIFRTINSISKLGIFHPNLWETPKGDWESHTFNLRFFESNVSPRPCDCCGTTDDGWRWRQLDAAAKFRFIRRGVEFSCPWWWHISPNWLRYDLTKKWWH